MNSYSIGLFNPGGKSRIHPMLQRSYNTHLVPNLILRNFSIRCETSFCETSTHQIPARKMLYMKLYLRTASRRSGVSQNCATVLDTPSVPMQNFTNCFRIINISPYISPRGLLSVSLLSLLYLSSHFYFYMFYFPIGISVNQSW